MGGTGKMYGFFSCLISASPDCEGKEPFFAGSLFVYKDNPLSFSFFYVTSRSALMLFFIPEVDMGKRLVLLGGGHAHMMVMQAIPEFRARGHEVTVVGPSPYHYYSGMGPGMLGGTYEPDDIRFAVADQVTSLGGTFLTDRAVRIDAHTRRVHLASGGEIPYDVLSCNTGSSVPSAVLDGQKDDIFSVKPIENLLKGQQRIKELLQAGETRIGVVGGGPAGLEVAGNIWGWVNKLGGRQAKIRLFAGKRFFGNRPEKVRALARKSLLDRDIEIIEQGYATNVRTGRVVLKDGSSWAQDIIFMAVGVRPSSLFADSGLPVGRDGGLLVNGRLHSVEHPDIFGGGDCISFAPAPLDKVGVYAVRENPILKHNLLAALEGSEMLSFDPGRDYLLIFNLGNGKGIFWKNRWVFHGKWAFRLKDYIDRKFMQRFKGK